MTEKQGDRSQGYRVTMLPTYKVTGLQGHRVPWSHRGCRGCRRCKGYDGYQGYEVTGLRGCSVAMLQGQRVTGLLGYRATVIQGYKATGPQDHRVTGLEGWKRCRGGSAEW